MTKSLLELAERLGGKPFGVTDQSCTGFALDSREVKPGDLFICVVGENVDGHDYAATALAHGAVACLATRAIDGPHILVKDLPDALAAMGRSFRKEFTGPVVGITGSAGKSSTKEFVAAALSPLGEILKTEGNRNTELTAPLLWVEADAARHKAAVVEMGMRGFGQIAHLCSFSLPTHGLITNIGWAHVELVNGREGIAKAKSELFDALPAGGEAFWWGEDEYSATLRQHAGQRPGFTFGFGPQNDCAITAYEMTSLQSCRVTCQVAGQQVELEVPATGRHMAINAAAALLVAHRLGVSLSDAARAIEGVKLPPMRMEVRPHGNGQVLLDTYNASPPSMIAALETLAESSVPGRKIAILGEMRELGPYSAEGHAAVGKAIKQLSLSEVLFIGPDTVPMLVAAEGGKAAVMSASLDDARFLLQNLLPGDLVLLKASRALALETLLEEAHA
ncbi:MAG: UDP-N-acetylmuramoyl-tripeptide--D-alanyl-D-alanine ligase [Armatimonadetes bacterium]|nr:UDP-N-acetylmuramoyl-tripeptide--D-alanyl-D-alanine ligase [Armatimonadota bacterium]